MAKQSAGLAIYRIKNNLVEILLAHPGGPFWAKKDIGGWSFPKGEIEEGDEPLQTARREFKEELGQEPPDGEPIPLGSVKTSSKEISIWAIEGDLDVSTITSNTFTIVWPRNSGQVQEFPEVDKAKWFTIDDATPRLHQNQAEFLPRLLDALKQKYPGQELKTAAQPKPEQTSLL
jgi:predicted NUDIX family NTP pyrophosphohydrolase